MKHALILLFLFTLIFLPLQSSAESSANSDDTWTITPLRGSRGRSAWLIKNRHATILYGLGGPGQALIQQLEAQDIGPGETGFLIFPSGEERVTDGIGPFLDEHRAVNAFIPTNFPRRLRQKLEAGYARVTVVDYTCYVLDGLRLVNLPEGERDNLLLLISVHGGIHVVAEARLKHPDALIDSIEAIFKEPVLALSGTVEWPRACGERRARALIHRRSNIRFNLRSLR